MTPEMLARQVSALLTAHAGLKVVHWELTEGGMNSTTVVIDLAVGRRVAKWVPAEQAGALSRGARAAANLVVQGIRSGAPFVWSDGELTHRLGDGEVAVLDFVDGRALTSGDTDQPLWGRALGSVHALTACSAGSIDSFFASVGLLHSPPMLESWVRDALSATINEVRATSPVQWAQLHTDPTPDAFRLGNDGDVGLIDWTGSTPGPALYDVASAVMYAGGRSRAAPLLSAYEQSSGIPVAPKQLRTFLRLRAVVQAVYFSRRLNRSDVTGVASVRDNKAGLEDARRM